MFFIEVHLIFSYMSTLTLVGVEQVISGRVREMVLLFCRFTFVVTFP